MAITVGTLEERERRWKEFLAYWTKEKIQNMTLNEYCAGTDNNSFCYHLEFGKDACGVADLGGIGGNPAHKFAIYSHKELSKAKHMRSNEKYTWKIKLGDTPNDVFVKVKKQILRIIDNIQNNKLDEIENDVLAPMVSWKIAFLYQNQEKPVLVDIYSKEMLAKLCKETAHKNISSAELQRRLMEKRGDEDVLVYGQKLWESLPKQNKEEDSVDKEAKMVLAEQKNSTKNSSISPLNQILYGPPGTGKTYSTITAALEILQLDALKLEREEQKKIFDGFLKDGRIRFVTFHQSFSYEDFVEGLRPVCSEDSSAGLRYEVEDGIFKEICKNAIENFAENYVLIIDEINRGNISSIFGELITLIEPSKRQGAEEELRTILPYSKMSFSVPNNLYIIGTMNTADRSLTGLDIALRRRFVFKEIAPDPTLLTHIKLGTSGISAGDILYDMNKRIEILLDKDHCIGHSYFMGLSAIPSIEDVAAVFRNNILPLLQEYFFDDWQKIHWVLNDHSKNATYQIIRQQNDAIAILGKDVAKMLPNTQCWEIHEDAFKKWEAFSMIANNESKTHQG